MNDRVLRLAVPNKGRLMDPTTELLKESGLEFERSGRALSAHVHNVDLDLLFVRADDIPELIADEVADLGITGQDLLAEYETALPELVTLGYGKCSLVAAVPNASAATKIDDLAGLTVASAHPHVTERFFADRNIEVTLVPLKGSVEVAPKLGVADAIVDLVSTGSTMLVNGLRPVDTLLVSQAVLVGSTAAMADRAGEIDRVVMALNAVASARRKRYLLLNAPAAAVSAITEIIPGLSAPTVVSLADPGMVAVHSVVDSDAVWNLLPGLKAAGGRDILVLPIGQMIT